MMILNEKIFKSFRKINSIAVSTFLEILRDKILYNIILCSFVLFFFQLLTSWLVVVETERILVDFGLTVIWISSQTISILVGSNLLNKEFERRTIYVILSKPLSRFSFVIGKFLGLSYILFLNWLLISAIHMGILFLALPYLSEKVPFEIINKTFLVGLLFIYLQSLMMASISFFFSTFTTTSLSIIFSVGYLLMGFNVNSFREVAVRVQLQLGAFISKMMEFVSYAIPNFENLSLNHQIIYALPISTDHILFCFFYGISIVSLFLALSGLLITMREI